MMELKKLFETRKSMRDCSEVLKDIERAKIHEFTELERLQRVNKVLTALSRDWRQTLNQMFKHRGVARMSLLRPGSHKLDSLPKLAVESGGILLWPEELVSYEDPRNGLDVSLDSVQKDLIRPMSDAMSEPCPDCSKPAYVVCNVHDAQGAPGTGSTTMHCDPHPYQHAQILLLCPACVKVIPHYPDFKVCQRCVT